MDIDIDIDIDIHITNYDLKTGEKWGGVFYKSLKHVSSRDIIKVND